MKEPKDYIGKWFELTHTIARVIKKGYVDGCYCCAVLETADSAVGLTRFTIHEDRLTKELTREQVKERLDKAYKEMTKAMLGEVGE